MTEFQVFTHSGTAQIQVTVFHTQIISTIGIVFDGKRRSLRGIQDIQFGHDDFNVTGRKIAVLAGTFAHLDDKLTAQMIGTFTKFGVHICIENQLCNAVAVAEVDKCHSTHLTCTLHPSGQRYVFACIGESQLTASMTSEHIYLNILVLLMTKVAHVFDLCNKIQASSKSQEKRNGQSSSKDHPQRPCSYHFSFRFGSRQATSPNRGVKATT